MKKLLIAALLIPAIANAGFISGNTLLEKMNSSQDADKAFALGYVIGAFDAFDDITHCNSPTSVTASQARDIIKKYIENNPASFIKLYPQDDNANTESLTNEEVNTAML